MCTSNMTEFIFLQLTVIIRLYGTKHMLSNHGIEYIFSSNSLVEELFLLTK